MLEATDNINKLIGEAKKDIKNSNDLYLTPREKFKHEFDIDIAIKVGVREAIMLNMLGKLCADDEMLITSYADLTYYLPYWTSNSVSRILGNLSSYQGDHIINVIKIKDYFGATYLKESTGVDVDRIYAGITIHWKNSKNKGSLKKINLETPMRIYKEYDSKRPHLTMSKEEIAKRNQEIIKMRFEGGCTLREIAEKVNRSATTVRQVIEKHQLKKRCEELISNNKKD